MKLEAAIRGNMSRTVLSSFGFTLHLPSLSSHALNGRIPLLVFSLSLGRKEFLFVHLFCAPVVLSKGFPHGFKGKHFPSWAEQDSVLAALVFKTSVIFLASLVPLKD